ncbi:CLUMA_CG021243, isoform A, partial [Clunio marinus]
QHQSLPRLIKRLFLFCRIYGARRCSKCLASISSSELVMRARHLVFHIQCFSCAICNQLLNKGDQFGIRSSAVYCRSHFDVSIDPSTPSPFPCSYTPSNPYCDSPNAPSSPSELSNLEGAFYGTHAQHLSSSGSNTGSITGLPQQPRQKGRPRKRKPKDIEAMPANLDLNSDYMDLGFGRGSMGNASSRTKRMRTSFKHHQLRTMKSYFAINHNPDAKDLKQLSQKTGLPKRVLQVWFQNARAKWRRMMMKQEGKAIDGEKGEGSIDLDTYNPHSPSYMLGPPSPTSME